jgi:hypothetical protein
MCSVFEVKSRLDKLFQFHGTVSPEPKCGEGPEPYRARALSYAQNLLPRGHAWGSMPLRHVPLDVAERFLITDRVAELKRPVGKLREVTETCPRTGRTTTKFFGDTRHCWESLPGFQQPRRATFTPGVGRGADSPHARAERAAAANEAALGRQALAAQRAAAGLR